MTDTIIDVTRPDVETQILNRIRTIDETLMLAKYGYVCDERSLLETRKQLMHLHFAFCGNW